MAARAAEETEKGVINNNNNKINSSTRLDGWLGPDRLRRTEDWDGPKTETHKVWSYEDLHEGSRWWLSTVNAIISEALYFLPSGHWRCHLPAHREVWQLRNCLRGDFLRSFYGKSSNCLGKLEWKRMDLINFKRGFITSSSKYLTRIRD